MGCRGDWLRVYHDGGGDEEIHVVEPVPVEHLLLRELLVAQVLMMLMMIIIIQALHQPST